MADTKLSLESFESLLRYTYDIRDATNDALNGDIPYETAIIRCKVLAVMMLEEVLEPKADKLVARLEYAKKRGL